MESNTNEEYQRRYDSMLESDLGMFTKDYVSFDVINFENENHYNVTITNKGRIKYDCDCPDFQRRCRYIGIPCKHIMFCRDNIEEYKRRGEEIPRQVISKFKGGLKSEK